MAEHTQNLQVILTLILLIGGFLAFILLKRSLATHPASYSDLIDSIADRCLSAKQFGILGGLLFLFYIAAGGVGQFFYEDQFPVVQLVVQWIIYALFALGLFQVNRPRITRFGLTLKNLKWLPIGFSAYFAAIPFIMISTLIYHEALELLTGQELEQQAVAQFMHGDLSWLQIAYIITAIIGAPIYEEVIFRGLLFPFILKQAGLKSALFFTAVLFAAVHLHIPSLLPIALLSIFLCFAYLRTKSIWACIGIHMMFNAIGIFAMNIMG